MRRQGEGDVREGLLRLSVTVAGLDADVADPLLQQRLTLVTDALAHALVDLADRGIGPPLPPWPVRPTTRRPARARVADVDLASCSAMAATLHQVGAEVSRLDGADSRARQVSAAALALAAALQDLVQEVSTQPGDRTAALPSPVTTRVQQRLRGAHALLQAAPAEQPPGARSAPGTTVQP